MLTLMAGGTKIFRNGTQTVCSGRDTLIVTEGELLRKHINIAHQIVKFISFHNAIYIALRVRWFLCLNGGGGVGMSGLQHEKNKENIYMCHATNQKKNHSFKIISKVLIEFYFID